MATAATPVLTGVTPRGVQRGKPVTLTFSGAGIGRGDPELISGVPGTWGKIKAQDENKLSVPLDVPADALVGFYPVQVRTADGITARTLIAVGDLPVVAEKEPNDEPSEAREVTPPVAVQGTCVGSDRDHVRVAARKGDPLVIEVEARRLGSGLDPVLTVFDAAGHEVASDVDASRLEGDPRLALSVPEDGTYLVVVNDAKYAGSGEAFYRLKLGRFACAEAVFPLGWRRGESVEVQFAGGNLPAPIQQRIAAPSDPELAWTTVALPSAPAGGAPFRFVLGDAPEQLEPQSAGPHPLPLGTVMNGRIAAPGEVDRYKVAVKPGQALTFDLGAARFGSRLDAVLKLSRPDGAGLAESDDNQGFDPRLSFTVPADLSEVVASVEDLLGRGGPSYAYRLRVRPEAPDYSLRVAVPAISIPEGSTAVVPVRVDRQNFKDAIQLSIAGDAPGVSASGGLIPAGAAEGNLLLTAAPGTGPKSVALEIWGEAGPPAQPLRRRARLAGDGTPAGPARPFALPAVVANGPPVKLEASATSLDLVHGQSAKLVVKATRPDGHKEEIQLATAGLPPGVGGGTATIAGDKSEATLEFNVDSNTPLIPASLLITARTRAHHRDESMTLPPIAAQVRRPYSVELLTPTATLPAGSKATLTALVRRVAPFNEPVKIATEGSVPPNVIVLPLKVAQGSTLAQVEITVGPQASPGSFDILLRASTEMPGRKQTKDYVIPDVPVRVTVTAPAGSSQ